MPNMTNQKIFLGAIALTLGLPLVFSAFAFSRFAPANLRHHREIAVADARTVAAAVRYLADPEIAEPRHAAFQLAHAATNPLVIQSQHRNIANTNVARMTLSNGAVALPAESAKRS